MATYEYHCKACGREFEAVQKMSDPDLVKCEVCGKDELEKLISWTSVGSDGWRAALTAPNPKEAFKGIHAVDRSRNRERFKGNTVETADQTEPIETIEMTDPAEIPAVAPKKDDA
ncbi:MAG TPA: zinc ribbon domain-containing protein [Kofleriaceae bacterium]